MSTAHRRRFQWGGIGRNSSPFARVLINGLLKALRARASYGFWVGICHFWVGLLGLL
jgi:hypothetical protein